MRIKLYECNSYSNLSWSSDNLTEIDKYCTTHIVIYFYLSYKYIPFFSIEVPNKTFNSMNPLTCLLNALESESIGMQKYNILKNHIRKVNLWQKL